MGKSRSVGWKETTSDDGGDRTIARPRQRMKLSKQGAIASRHQMVSGGNEEERGERESK